MTLVDGSKAVVYVLGAQHNGAKTVHDGHVLATVETNERDAGLDANDLYTVLSGQRCDQPPECSARHHSACRAAWWSHHVPVAPPQWWKRSSAPEALYPAGAVVAAGEVRTDFRWVRPGADRLSQ